MLLQLAVPGYEGVCLKVPHVQAVVQHCGACNDVIVFHRMISLAGLPHQQMDDHNDLGKATCLVPHPHSYSLQIRSRQASRLGLKKKQPNPRTRCIVTTITHFPSHVHSQT